MSGGPLFEQAGRRIREADEDVDAATHAAERARFVERSFRGPKPRPALRIAGVLAAATIALAGGWTVARSPRPLSVAVRGGESAFQGGSLHVIAREHDAAISFSDGSEVVLAPAAAADVRELGELGAEIALERGAAEVHVVHRDGTRWIVHAGPYAVRVTGTRFTVAWSGERLAIGMHEGAVHVDGPELGGGVDVRDGASFSAGRKDAPPPSTPETSAAPPAAAAPSPTATEPPHPRPIPWAELARRGRYADVVAAAEAHGVDRAVATQDADDLWALADSARLTAHPTVARSALAAFRARFPLSPHAPTAAFLLGRLDEDGGDPDRAVSWYARYLDEAPTGPLAAEAAGRRMLGLRAAGRRDAANRAAADYLTRFPNGPYAAIAREIATP